MNQLAANLRKLRLDQAMTQEQIAEKLGVSAQSVSRWENAATLPDVLLLPDIAKLYGVLVDDLFKPAPKGYENNALRLLAVYERTGNRDDFITAADEFDKLIREGRATADDWRSYGVIHEYMMDSCIKNAQTYYDRAMEMSQTSDPEMYHRTLRQKIQLRSQIGQATECIAEQDSAVQSMPEDPQVWIDLAHAQYMGKQHEAALRTCEAALAHFPQEGLLHVYAGDSCRVLKRYDEAITHWEAAVALDDKFLDAMYSMAFCRGDMGQFDKAADIWEDISSRLEATGLTIEAQWPREMAAKCRAQVK